MKLFELVEVKDSDRRCTNYLVKVDGVLMDMAADGYLEMNHWTSMSEGWYAVHKWNACNLIESFEGTLEECKEFIDQSLNGIK